jgi:hypothetical protein
VSRVYQRILELSEIIQPIGFEIEGQRGRLRQLLHRLGRFHDEVIRADSGGTTRTLAEVAHLTLRVGNAILTDVDRNIANVVCFVAEWDFRPTSIRRSMERLSWLLDGWGHVCDLWDGADAAKAVERHQRITEIMRIIPVVPRRESPVRIHVEPTNLHRRQNRVVQRNEDWRTGQLDSEMSARLSKIQARKQT